MTNHRTPSTGARPGWKSLDQLSDFWGLSRTRANLVVQALVRSGRMEVRRRPADRPPRREFRMTES